MGHSTAVLSGPYLEIFEYEKPIRPRDPVRDVERTKRSPTVRGHSASHQRSVFSLRRARRNFIRIARSNLTGTLKPAFLTLTFASIVSHAEGAPTFNGFIKKLTYHYPGLRYIAVPEFQKRGSVHYHLLVWGIPKAVVYNERNTRHLASLWGHGFIDIIPTDGSTKLASYMAKYLFKAIQDVRLAGRRAYMASQNILRPVFNFPISALHHLEYMFDSPIHREVLTDRKYPTDWLGWCRYRLIKIIPQNSENTHHEG